MPRKKRAPASGPIYTYRAHDDSGRVISGTTDALSRDEIVQKLTERGYTVDVLEGDRRTEAERRQEELGEEPLTRLVKVIFEEAAKQEAQSIRAARPRGARMMTVSYLISGSWHEVMGLPSYMWPPLRAYLARMANVRLSYGVCREPGSIGRREGMRLVPYTVTFGRNRVLLERQGEMLRLSDSGAPVPRIP